MIAGTRARLKVQCYDANNNLTDPGGILLKVASPRVGNTPGAVTTYTYPAQVVRDSLGTFHMDVLFNQAGQWFVHWETSGPNQEAVQEDLVEVAAAKVT